MTTTDNDVQEGDALLTFIFTTNTIVDASGADYNFIKVDTPVNTGGLADWEAALATAVGMNGNIDVVNGTDDVLFAFWDATNSQMVLGLVDGANDIDDDNHFDVIATIGMTKTDFDAFGVPNLNFVD